MTIQFRKKHFVFAPPWLLAAAIGLLVLIIVVFTVNNLRREKRLMDESLLHKGLALARFVGAGTRASMMMGPDPARRVQRLMEQAALEEDILYLALIDRDGRVAAHSDPQQVGAAIGRDLPGLQKVARDSKFQVRAAGQESVFEVVSPFRPFERGGMHRQFRGPGRGGPWGGMRDGGPPRQPPNRSQEGPEADWCRFPGQGGGAPSSHLMLVGLDMSEQAAVVRQNRFHIMLMAAALLLVGAGGWFSLLVAQGYRVSQDTLRHMKAFTGLLISRLPVGIVATGPDGTVKTCNEAAASLTGKKGAGKEGGSPAEMLPPVLAAHFQGGAAAARGEVLDQEVSIAAPAGDRIIEASSVPIREKEGAFMGRVLLLYDVTEQRRLERRLRRQERFVALGKMAAGVAHEVRNPLSSIKGLATILGGKFPAGSREAESARLLVREVERLNRAITELLDFARPLPLRSRPLEIRKLIEDSLALVRRDAQALDIEIREEVEEGLPPLAADPDRLNQVLLNLYLNAIQALEEGGTLKVSASLDPDRRRLNLAIEDTGRGIEAGDLDRIFDPYFTTKAAGTGLGLTMVQKIVEEHGGQIAVTSEAGRGTRVVLELPLAGEA